jgi:CBS-domain-containing membrane protein
VSTLVKDVMTSRVISVAQDAPFGATAAALCQHQVGALPVVDQAGRLVGVVSEADLLAKLALGGDDQPRMIGGILHHQQLEKARATTAAELMSTLPIAVSPDDTVEHAARLMYQRRVKHLPVVDADSHVVGIISRADVLSVFKRTDEDIRDEVTADVALSTSPADAIDVAVYDGIVILTGTAESSELASRIVRRVRHIEGVVAIRDRVSCPPPSPGDVLVRFPVD